MGLVKRKRWRLSLVRQRDISDCGAACLASVCSYYGLYMPVSRLRQMAGTDQKGTSVFGIVEAAIQCGLYSKGLRATYESLELTTLPAIIHMIIDDKVSHYMVLVKVNSKGILAMDPAEGRFRQIPKETFMKMWTGVLVLFSPGEKFRGNKKVTNFRRITELVKPYQHLLIWAAFCAAMVSVLGMALSVYVKEIVDEILVRKEIMLLNVMSAVMIILLVIQFSISIIKNCFVLKTGREINSLLIMKYYHHVLHLPRSFFNNMRVGEMLSRINDAVKITVFIHEVVVNLVVDVLIFVFSLGLMLYYNWKMALLVSAIVPVYVILFVISHRINKRWQRKVAESGAVLEASLVESLSAAATISNLSLQQYFIDKIKVKLNNLLGNIYLSSIRHGHVQLSADFSSKIFTIILLWAGSYYVMKDHLTAGELISFYTLLAFFSTPVLSLLNANKTYNEAMISADRLFEIMDLQTVDNGWKKIYPWKDLKLKCENVRFRYGNNEPVLKDVNLSFRNSSVTGIKGKSGCGKSTLAALLVGAYTPDAGKITVNDIDISEIDRNHLTEMIGIVQQKTDLFAATVTENITAGREYDQDLLDDIIERLDIARFIELNTFIDEQGNNLSGGQKQRISIARALYRKPPVLILDEATASIDAATEEKIMQTIEWYKNCGNTVIIIAHSESTLKICDNIVILENGVIQ